MNRLVCQLKPYIQPFERTLALQELASLSRAVPQKASDENGNDNLFMVSSKITADELAAQVTYWESIGAGPTLLTQQVLRESTQELARRRTVSEIGPSTALSLGSDIRVPHRRCLRYGPHGIHEYRGKFFPQLVRALINISGAPQRGIVADPMCGSGTTLVEAVLAGRLGIGLDLNPFSSLLAETKCSLLRADPDELMEAFRSVRDKLQKPAKSTGRSHDLPYFSKLPPTDQDYLIRWISPDALAELDRIASLVESTPSTSAKALMKIALSNIIRPVSWQKTEDLRVRREMRDGRSPIEAFLSDLENSVKSITALLLQLTRAELGLHEVSCGSALDATSVWEEYKGEIDTIITSPPYATALPYLDTDRLSLSYLGLLERPKQRALDASMIGNREVTTRQHRELWARFKAQSHQLPNSVSALIEDIHQRNSTSNVGFRRKNLAALLAKYFFDMRAVLSEIRDLLRPGSTAYVVVGTNHTVAGNKKVAIDTASLLVDVGKSVGLDSGDHIPMELLVSRDIFRRNTIASERIVVLSKPAQSASV